jgi:acyl dehydratase
MIGLPMDAIAVGDSAEITRRASDEDIEGFVDAVGDYNPVHSDREYAAGTIFREPIAPGIWTAGLVSAVIGTRLPGPGAIYLSQKPVKLGDVIRARVEVLETNPQRNRMRLRTVCTNQRGEDVLTGEALVMPPKQRIVYERSPTHEGLLAFWTLGPWAWATHAMTMWAMVGLSGWPRPRACGPG